MLEAILSAIWAYCASIWGVARMIFGTLDAQLMKNCLSVMAVVFLISVIDSLPERLRRLGERKIKKSDDDDEYEWVRVRKQS